MLRLIASFIFCLSFTSAEETHWSLRPLEQPAIPKSNHTSPVDAFIWTQLESAGLSFSALAKKRVWIRRVYFNLIGLPPSPAEIHAYLNNTQPNAEELVVDKLLVSPRHGERWARHWMDVVRYAETHGHDEDAIRENAWPYRDWLIRALNDDMPYSNFVRSQVAGDMIIEDVPDATAATGFLACGPWDSSSQMGIQDGTTDKKIAQYLDRDDMLSATMSTFTSTTVHCARCHDHKFDPISLQDYYSLQAVFAGVDKADRLFDNDQKISRKRASLLAEQQQFANKINDPDVTKEISIWATRLERSLPVWVPLILKKVNSSTGTPHTVLPDNSVLFKGTPPERDTYNISGITDLKKLTAVQIEVLTDPSLPMNGPGRAPNGNLHLSEIHVHIDDQPVPIIRASSDFNQADWEIGKAFDGNEQTAWGIHPQEGQSHQSVFIFNEPISIFKETSIKITLKQLHGGSHLIGRLRIGLTDGKDPDGELSIPTKIANIIKIPRDGQSSEQKKALALHYLKTKNSEELATLPEPGKVFGVTSNFTALGNFKPAIKPRVVHILERGDIHSPQEVATPGTLSCITGLPSRFQIPKEHNEGARRLALANWLSDPNNILTWRSIVNRVWHYHFGRGIVSTPNDFGKMGTAPTHPKLLDWLAVEFRNRGGSLKWLHKTIVLSTTYRQSTNDRPECQAIDSGNKLLWRMNRQRLDAESIHDTVLSLSGMLDLTMGGPSARQFTSKKGIHITPTLNYLGFNPDDPANLRRSVYRFVFRTVPDPLMEALDCPNASQLAPRRESSVTALQALAMLNNRFLVRQSEHIANKLKNETDPTGELFLRAYGRPGTASEIMAVTNYKNAHGLANTCRVILNSSEFLYIQ
ncbi:MAG TPA: DUF1553 domain-containing protein [Verrucomicrobia bacterium]|nr:DUF1553 domain-containing protein [Verrucomicrobiales bacterium]HIL53875.1 DUF1553 domain-containing protein [Verrucomicrobiota bacterium]